MSEILISQIKIGSRHRKDFGDIEGLAASIEDVGLLQPVVVRPDYSLVAGARRIQALRRLGWEKTPVYVATNLEEELQWLKAERDENTCRKDFNPSEEVAIGEPIEQRLKQQAVERKAEGQRSGGRGKKKLGDESSPSNGKVREQVAAVLGIGGQRYERAKAVVKAAEKEPEKFGKLKEDMDRTGKVNGAHKRLKTLQAAETIAAEPPPLPVGPFRVIAIDPPWKYESRAEDESHRAANPYPSMTIEEIKALDVPGVAHGDCVLWLWTTNAHMREAFGILEAWGFVFKTILTWVKDRMGTGDWLRGQTEHCLMAIRGKPTVTLTNQTTVLQGPLRKHSQKPDEFYRLVESLCPGSKLEMFSREKREGWAVHGNDI